MAELAMKVWNAIVPQCGLPFMNVHKREARRGNEGENSTLV